MVQWDSRSCDDFLKFKNFLVIAMMRSKLASDALIYTIANFAAAGVPFLLVPIMTRFLDPEAYGRIAMFNVSVSVATIIVGLNMHGALMVRFFDRNKAEVSKYTSTVLALLVFSTLLALLLTGTFANFLIEVTDIPGNWMFVAVLGAGAQFVSLILLTIWQAEKSPFKFGSLRIGQAVLDGLLSVWFVVFALWSWEGRVIGLFSAWFITALIAIYFLFKEDWIFKSLSKSYALDALRFGIPLIPHTVGGLLLGMADRFLVTNILGSASTGIYVLAIQIGMILGIAADSVNKAFAPWLMSILQNKCFSRDLRIVKYTYVYFAAMLAIAWIGGACAQWIVGVLAGEKYAKAAELINYILFGNAFVAMYYMVANYVFFARKTELMSLNTTIVGAISVALTWWLIKENGIIGAAQGFMCSQILMFISTWIIAQRCHRMPWDLGKYSSRLFD